jgi:hypothetical protein
MPISARPFFVHFWQEDFDLLVALHGAFRYTPHNSDFSERQAAEKLQIDHFGENGLHSAKLVEYLADLHKFPVVDRILHGVGVERIDLEQPPRFWACRSRAWSMISPRITRAASPMNRPRSGKRRLIQVCFLQQGRSAEAYGCSRPRKFTSGQPVQFGVKSSKKRVGGRRRHPLRQRPSAPRS